MADIQTWNGQATFVSGSSTPFGFYDGDTTFRSDAERVAKFCATRLGYPLLDVELQSGSFFACFEEAVTTYGNEVFQYKIRENYLSLEGTSLDTDINNSIIDPSLSRVINISSKYGTEAEVGGNVRKYTGGFEVTTNQQDYDLEQWAIDQGISGSIEIRKVFYEAPPAITRYFDPYAGTGTGIQSLMDTFGFGSFSPGVNFLLMPASYDVLKMQAIEFNDQIRRSAYSFEIIDNQLKLFPVPKTDGKMFFEYYKVSEKSSSTFRSGSSLVKSIADVPYRNPVYSEINSVGRQWIFKYTLALAKEMLGYVRGKYGTVPVPGAEVTLNQSDLLTDARSEREALIEYLRETLEQTSRQSQLERRSSESEYMGKTLNSVPMKIFVG